RWGYRGSLLQAGSDSDPAVRHSRQQLDHLRLEPCWSSLPGGGPCIHLDVCGDRRFCGGRQRMPSRWTGRRRAWRDPRTSLRNPERPDGDAQPAGRYGRRGGNAAGQGLRQFAAVQAAVSLPRRWTRRGVVVPGPPAGHPWWASHAQTPTPLVFGPRHWRVYFSARDASNRSRIIFVDTDPLDDMRVLSMHDIPLLALGPPGRFDSAGQGASHAVRDGDKVLLYYVGMHLRVEVPYAICVGLAESLDG